MSVLTEETVEMTEGVLVKATDVGLGDSDGVTTVVDGGTCNKGELSVGAMDEDDVESDEEEEEINVGDS
jgi:hypothetical protein